MISLFQSSVDAVAEKRIACLWSYSILLFFGRFDLRLFIIWACELPTRWSQRFAICCDRQNWRDWFWTVLALRTKPISHFWICRRTRIFAPAVASEFFLGVAKLVVQTVAQTWIVNFRIFVSRHLPKTFGNAFSRVHLTRMPKNSTYQHALSTERIQFVSMLVIWNVVLTQIPVIPGNSLYPLTGGSGWSSAESDLQCPSLRRMSRATNNGSFIARKHLSNASHFVLIQLMQDTYTTLCRDYAVTWSDIRVDNTAKVSYNEQFSVEKAWSTCALGTRSHRSPS